jgi:hypothetical protein
MIARLIADRATAGYRPLYFLDASTGVNVNSIAPFFGGLLRIRALNARMTEGHTISQFEAEAYPLM